MNMQEHIQKKVICLIDGEHYLPVTKEALELLEDSGKQVLAAVFIGGTEKIGSPEEVVSKLGVKVYMQKELRKGEMPLKLIMDACAEHQPDEVIDLSDEPIVTYETRFQIASQLMLQEITYRGADFVFTPPTLERILQKPSLGVIGTGKRVGKTAVAGFIARCLHEKGYNPTIVTMGRGGPPDPEVIRGDEVELTPQYLLDQSKQGKHAASDHWEDALTSRLLTVGCRRCGGGMVGQPFISNVARGAEMANELAEDLIIMEGSGATMPPVWTNRRIVIVGAAQPLEFIRGYFGRYRIMLSDLAVVAMCEEPLASPEKVESIQQALEEINPGMGIALTVFRPKPLGDLTGKNVMLAMSAPESVMGKIISYLEEDCSCSVVGHSSSLSNRAILREDIMESVNDADVLLTEVKAAAIDVATSMGFDAGLDVMYMDNIPVLTGGNVDSLESSVIELTERAIREFERGDDVS